MMINTDNISTEKQLYNEILNIFSITERPLQISEIRNYLNNNLGIDPTFTSVVLKKLKTDSKIISIKINGSNRLYHWVLYNWVDWHKQELKREFRRFGITKNAIKSIEIM